MGFITVGNESPVAVELYYEGPVTGQSAADLNAILEALDLRDVILFGFLMGTAELARYVSRYGHERVAKLAFQGSVHG